MPLFFHACSIFWASALVLAGCLLAGAALPALAASAKEEVIYANLDASGTVTGVYAVNSFAVQAGDTVTDHGSYTAVRNMTTTDPLKHSGDTVTATVAEDGKLYYEGTMDTATALPWLVKLTYMLDGAEIAPEELGGKSGALAIRLQVSRNPACTGDFFDQYALQVTMTLDTDRAQNIVADGATMANVGSNKQLSYILLPGSDSDVTVTADVTDFAMNAISLNGVKLRLNLDLDGADLTGMLDRLQGGSVQLDDGANALADGIAQVQAGLDTLNGKSGELTGGSAKVKAALTQMQTALNGVSASTDQLTTLLDASTQIQNGIAQLDAGAAQLDEQVSYDAYKAILKENGLDLDQLKDGNAKAMEQLEQLARVMPQLKDVILLLKGSSANIDAMETYLNTVHDGVAQLHAGSSTLNSQYGQFDAGVRQLANALTGMLGNLSVLTDGVNQLASRYGQLDSGLNAYTDGVAQLKAGVQQLTDGAARLTAGTGELRSNVSGIDMGDQLDSLRGTACVFRLGQDSVKLLDEADILMISPGVPIDSPIVLKAREMNIPVTGELEVASQLCEGTLVALTGTNGKTTTVSLLGEIYRAMGKIAYVAGNIGYPLSAAAMLSKPENMLVAEVSSFQLETTDTFHPRVAAVLNITEDHLNRHYTMENYAAVKRRIFARQNETDTAVLNYDDPACRAMAEGLRARVAWFSRTQEVPQGAFVREDKITIRWDGAEKAVCRTDEVYIPGPHNLENALAAAMMACASGVPQFRLGAHTDVLSGAPKAAGIELLLRTMNPEWIAVDEITAEADIRAMTMAANCGVGLLATIHAQDRAELEGKPLARMLLASGAFAQAIVIENRNGERTYRWEELAP